jgi:hypothetical protein
MSKVEDVPSIAKSSTFMTPTPSPLSALHSSSILPETVPPATKNGSESLMETLTLGWCVVAFMASGRDTEDAMAEIGAQGSACVNLAQVVLVGRSSGLRKKAESLWTERS